MKKLQKKKMMVENNIRPVDLSFLHIYIFLLFFLAAPAVTAQKKDSAYVNKKRLKTFIITSGVAYTGTLTALHQLWYKNSDSQPFRFFNDNRQWKQVDKVGHFFSAYYFSNGTSRALKWCNVPEKKSDLTGALSGFLILVPIEIFDGFSQAYGASSGDLVANAAGSSFFLGQQLVWGEQRLIPKFSFQRSDYAELRPEVLGDNLASEILKDYNGQTHWISADMDRFMRFPRWLNIAAGYGAHGMIFARDHQNLASGYPPARRQYYLSLDFDLSAIPTRSKLLKTLIFIASMVKLPAPALEFSRKGVAFHPLLF